MEHARNLPLRESDGVLIHDDPSSSARTTLGPVQIIPACAGNFAAVQGIITLSGPVSLP
jgi:hypothetical protein